MERYSPTELSIVEQTNQWARPCPLVDMLVEHNIEHTTQWLMGEADNTLREKGNCVCPLPAGKRARMVLWLLGKRSGLAGEGARERNVCSWHLFGWMFNTCSLVVGRSLFLWRGRVDILRPTIFPIVHTVFYTAAKHTYSYHNQLLMF